MSPKSMEVDYRTNMLSRTCAHTHTHTHTHTQLSSIEKDITWDFLGELSGRESACPCSRHGFDP